MSAPITEEIVRKRTARYVSAVLGADGMSYVELKKAIGVSSNKHISEYAAGIYAPTVDKIIRMYEVTGVSPGAFDIPVFNALKCAERMREMFREGHTLAEFAKALQPTHRQVINKLIEGQSVTTISLLKFQYYWHANDVENLVQQPKFRETCGRMHHAPKKYCPEMEFKYITNMWGSLAETAHEIRTGLWEWFTDSFYRMELEHISDATYEFRAYFKPTDKLSVKREVTIA
jgi:transcriptional regulator with XRE-family HTH domain